jgi:hypothetical protein
MGSARRADFFHIFICLEANGLSRDARPGVRDGIREAYSKIALCRCCFAGPPWRPRDGGRLSATTRGFRPAPLSETVREKRRQRVLNVKQFETELAILVAALALFLTGCVVHEHYHRDYGYYRAGPPAHHHHYPGCGHEFHGGVWITVP